MPAHELLWSVVAGAGVGFLSGVFGLGGGFLIVPVLTVFLGVDVRYAVGATACQVLGPTTTSLLARRTDSQHFRLPIIVAGGQCVGTIVGASLLEHLGNLGPVEWAGREVPTVDLLVHSFYLLILLAIGLFALWETGRHRAGTGMQRGWISGWHWPPHCEPAELNSQRLSIPLLAWFGVIIGLVSGLLGITGGLLILPGLVYLWGLPTKVAVRYSLVMVWIGAIPATITHAWHGNVDLFLVTALLAGGTLGAKVGSEMGEKLSSRKLRSRFGWVVLAAAALVAWRLYSLLYAT